MEALSRETVTTAVAGSEFTIALTSKGTAFAFGHGDMTGTVWWGRGWEGRGGGAAAERPATEGLRAELQAWFDEHGADVAS